MIVRMHALVTSVASKPESSVAHEILSYFVEHPQAADTLEGIARWRLLETLVRKKVNETREALDWLVETGYLVEVKRLGAERVFRLNQDKAEAARQFLSRPGSAEKEG